MLTKMLTKNDDKISIQNIPFSVKMLVIKKALE